MLSTWAASWPRCPRRLRSRVCQLPANLPSSSTVLQTPVQPVDELAEARQRARAHLEQIDRGVKERERERRERRVQGKLSHSLEEKVGNCNPKLLKALIELARYHL